MADNLKPEDLSREQILDLADASGRKLGFLLAVSAFDDEVKNAIVNILDQATPSQLDILCRMLEEGYLRANNQSLNDFLKSELENIKMESDGQAAILEKETLRKLDSLKF